MITFTIFTLVAVIGALILHAKFSERSLLRRRRLEERRLAQQARDADTYWREADKADRARLKKSQAETMREEFQTIYNLGGIRK